MPCFTERRLGSLLLVFGLAILAAPIPFSAPAAPGDGQDLPQPGSGVLSSDAEPLTVEQCRSIALRLGDPAERAEALAELESAPFFPVRTWVDLLVDPELAIRLGALEILEDRNATDLAFDPWEHDPVRRREQWRAWDEWAESGGETATAVATPSLGPGAMQSYLRDIVNGDRDKTERALGKMQPYADEAIAAIENYLTRQQDPGSGVKARLREAQFRLLLDSIGFAEARRVARELSSGGRDGKIEALDLLAKSSREALPLVGEALRDEDSLVRERAMDVLLSIGKSEALHLAVAHLENDPDPNVAHAALRAFGRIEGTASVNALVPYLESEDEDEVTTALQSLSLLGDSARSARPDIGSCLSHESWRVRAGALQFLLKTRLTGYEEKIRGLLDDPDSFVRATAVQAVLNTGTKSSGAPDPFGAGGGKELLEKTRIAILGAVEKHSDLQGPVFRAFDSKDIALPDELLATLVVAPQEVKLSAMRSLSPGRSREMEVLKDALNGSDPDLRAAALQVLAKSPDTSDFVRSVLIEGLTRDGDDATGVILEHLRWSAPKSNSRSAWEKAVAEFRGRDSPSPPAVALSAAPAGIADDLLDAFGIGSPTSDAPTTSQSTEDGRDTEKSDALMNAFGIGTTEAPLAETPDSFTDPAPAASPADALMGAFGIESAPGKTKTVGDAPAATTIEGALMKISVSAPLIGNASASARARKATALLIKGGSPLPVSRLFDSLDSMDVQDRADLATDLGDQPHPGFVPLWAKLLQDPSTEVRQRALRSAFDDDFPVLVRFALEEAFSPGSPSEAPDLYSRYLEYLCENDDTRKIMAEIGRSLLDVDRPVPTQVLGLIILRNAQASSDRSRLEEKLDAKDYWVRRAAVMALGRETKDELIERFEDLVSDDSVWVREAAAAVFGKDLKVWTHHFSDTVQMEDADYQNAYEFRSLRGSSLFAPMVKGTELDPGVADGLRDLTEDPSEKVRLAAWMSLLANREEIDVVALTDLLSQSPDREKWQRLLGSHLAENADTLGPALRPLLAFVDPDRIDADKWEKLRRQLGAGSESSLQLDFSSFAASSETGADGREAPAQFVAPDADPEATDGNEVSGIVRLVFFYNPGCHECDAVRADLQSFVARFPNLKVVERNIRETEAVVLNEALCTRFRVEPTLRQVTPAVFLQEGALIKGEIDRPALHELIQRALAVGDRGDWLETKAEEMDVAREAVDRRFASIGLVGVLLAGLLDGINPCAFATMIFLLSYLQVSRRNPREILAVGGAFIAAVFLTYFALGLGLVEIVARLEGFRTAGKVLNYLLAAGCLWIAWMSFRDARLARQGRLTDMSLKLPDFLKKRIRSVIRTGTRSRRFVVAAFLSGVVVSVLELACTGQVYLPTIVYAMKSGADMALWFLAVYNLAFILPLVVIFMLAWRGMRSDALVEFQQNHTSKVKFALGLLFFALFAALLWSGRL